MLWEAAEHNLKLDLWSQAAWLFSPVLPLPGPTTRGKALGPSALGSTAHLEGLL